MIIDVNKHIRQKTYSGKLAFSYNPPERLITVPLTSFSGAAEVDIEYWLLEDDSVEAKGSVKFTLRGSCSRCLRPAEKDVTGEISAYFVPEGGNKAEFDDYEYKKGVIDLTECVNDAIMGAMPYSLLCSEDCKGIEYSETDD